MNGAKIALKNSKRIEKALLCQYFLIMLHFYNILFKQQKNGVFIGFFVFFNSNFQIVINVISID